MAVLCVGGGWGGEGSGQEKAVRHSLLSFLLHHLPPPHVPHGGPFTSYWKTTDPCGLYHSVWHPSVGMPWLLFSPEHSPLFSWHGVRFTVFTSCKNVCIFKKIANGKAILRDSVREDEPRLSTEVMMVQRLRGRSPRIWLRIPVHYGVTLGKLWNVFFFLRAPKIILFLT